MDPYELIRHANRLIKAQRGAPKQIDLRRAISATYYALFHCLLRAAADNLIGSTGKARKSAAYSLVYRAYEHGSMLQLCQHASKGKLPPKVSAVLSSDSVSKEIQYVADAFTDLQGLRHKADYDPNIRFYKSDALAASVRAAFAITQFEAADAEARRLFLLAMLLKPR